MAPPPDTDPTAPEEPVTSLPQDNISTVGPSLLSDETQGFNFRLTGKREIQAHYDRALGSLQPVDLLEFFENFSTMQVETEEPVCASPPEYSAVYPDISSFASPPSSSSFPPSSSSFPFLHPGLLSIAFIILFTIYLTTISSMGDWAAVAVVAIVLGVVLGHLSL
ncbi:hypothetical protein BGX38DRAFT_891446 [Terfezia claveryi]|nr:hypothetical protein BGX38DRAFT_891446 [Terfezia claveryi]